MIICNMYEVNLLKDEKYFYSQLPPGSIVDNRGRGIHHWLQGPPGGSPEPEYYTITALIPEF